MLSQTKTLRSTNIKIRQRNVVPNGGIDTKFLSDFDTFLREKIATNWRFFVVVGGGSTARHYIESAKRVKGKISDWDLDYLGIHTTRLNAHLIRTIFQDIAHPRIISHYEKKIQNLTQPLVVAAGWKPGRSTDYDAVLLARDYDACVIINMSNIQQVFDRDPNKFPDAKPIDRISWVEFESIVGKEWSPGGNHPFDPVATKLAKKIGGIKVFVVGKDLSNVSNILSGQHFV